MSDKKFEILKFVSFKSFVHSTFWHKLAEIKIDIDKLDDTPKYIYGYYSNYRATDCLLEVDYSAFNSEFIPPKYNYTAHGILYNKNTIEDFKDCDKTELLECEGKKFLDDIQSGAILENPQLLARFLILSYADLKVHKYYYWFAFPAAIYPIVQTPFENNKPKPLAEIPILSDQILKIYTNITDEKNKSFFIIKINENDKNLQYRTLKDEINLTNKNNNFQNVNDLKNIFFCFCDPSEFEHPAWILRLYLIFLYESCPNLRGKIIQIVGIRQNVPDNLEKSLIWNVIIPEIESGGDVQQKFVGWELNQNGKMCPKVALMADTMDPSKLAENSVNLNLKLMKWRLLPELNLDIIANTKCLLFGAGTLGCAVARNLLAWGFKTITFLDSGKVSFANPVRQCLYKHQDAVSGKKMKATTAAERVLEVNPNSKSEGFVIQIPMPGHPVGDSMREEITKSLNIIEENVQKHDVLILLTDSRESRWLPTLLGAFYKKIVITAALGFDSYLVMRHGSHKKLNANLSLETETNINGLHCIPGSELGCYFCNDVTAPGDSMKNRTLDQQCTVTRPGVSNISASYAVELLVSLLQHKYQDLAPAYYATMTTAAAAAAATGSNQNDNDPIIPEELLGIIPHSIRGMLCTYENILPATSKFSQCIACSEKVLKEYESRGKKFLFDVFDSTKYLEDLTEISNLGAYENEIIECDDSDVEWSD